jgi:hypothetical protein
MRLTVALKLLPTAEQASALETTLQRANDAANLLSAVAEAFARMRQASTSSVEPGERTFIEPAALGRRDQVVQPLAAPEERIP